MHSARGGPVTLGSQGLLSATAIRRTRGVDVPIDQQSVNRAASGTLMVSSLVSAWQALRRKDYATAAAVGVPTAIGLWRMVASRRAR